MFLSQIKIPVNQKSIFSKWVTLSFMVFVMLIQSACVDLEFDEPPAGGLDPNLPVNSSIAELKARHVLGEYEEIIDDVIISGTVISNDEEGNFFKQLVIADMSGGIEIRVEMTDLHNIFPVGRKVYVKAKGLWLGDYNDLIQLGAGVDNAGDMIRLPESLIAQYIIPATYGNPVIPKTISIDDLTAADVSTLVRFDNVQFVSADAGITWSVPQQESATNRDIEDCFENRLILRTSDFARFASDLTPEGNGSLTGVLSVFRGDYQLMIRDLNDVMMTGDRCSSGALTYPIDTVRRAFTEGSITFAGNIKGIVISDRSSQSVHGLNLYVEDGSGGLVVRLTDDHTFNLGDEVVINLAGGTLTLFNGLFQVNGISPGAIDVVGHPGDITPRNATVLEILQNAQEWESTLVRIDNVTLTSSDGNFAGDVTVTDATGSMLLFTLNAASFSSNALPAGPVTLTAIVSEFNSPQLIMRNAADISGGGTGTGLIDESFDAIADDADVLLPGWKNIAVKGDRLWRGKIFMGNHYAQATAFGDTQAEMESWLITPSVLLDEPMKLSFESAQAFWTHQGLSVWISSDFNGSDVTAATWTQLNPVLAQQSSTQHEFIPSGDVDLSSFSGNVHIGFKYAGSAPGGLTTSSRLDNIKIEKL